ncbi:unnamed protein product [Prorocentrum cordatum]|uniref:Uncharacterized protein n=1 Tax=Prorocentrum cordatum TaxID=2364126 RepID=A0ABN9T095_9DINO|nr:unnamed protein product [Polarella glacialis]
MFGLLGFLINDVGAAEPAGLRSMTPLRGQRIGESRLPAPWGQQHDQGVQGLPAAELAQQSTSKVPPFWAPYLEQRGYPFRLWVQDVTLWCAATELQPQQRGPAIVQRLGGTARYLCREVPLEAIAMGRFDQLGNQIEDGVQMLIAGLRRRFGPLDVLTFISTIVELLNFRRQERESVDDAITRLEALRARVAQLDDPFAMPTPVLALPFLEAVHVPKAVYPLVLQGNNGQLPTTIDQLNALIGMVRQQGHFAEHTHAGPQNLTEGYRGKGNHGQHWFTDESTGGASTWKDTAAYMYGQNADRASRSASPSSQHYVVRDDEGYECGAVCSSYLYEDEPGDEDSMTDDDDLDVSEFTQEELQEYYGDAERWDYDTLLHEYLFAKRRFRHIVQRNSRRARFPRSSWSLRVSSGRGDPRKGGSSFGRGRGHGKGYHCGGSAVTPGSLAGGKGKRNRGGEHFMSGTPGAANPRGSDGRAMQRHEYGSETHLVAACPKRKGKSKGKHLMSCNTGSSGTGPQQSGTAASDAMMSAYAPAPAQPRTGALSGVLHWFTEDVRTPSLQIDDLDEVSIRGALDWETLDMRDNIAEHDMLSDIQASVEDTFVEERPATGQSLIPGGVAPRALPVPGRPASTTAASASPEWSPWWRVDQLEDASGENYLVRARMQNRSGEALLVDPGAQVTLLATSGATGWPRDSREQEFHRQFARPSTRFLRLAARARDPSRQRTLIAIKWHCREAGGQDATYEAPVLPNSSAPALLGREALRDQRILLDCFNNRMYRIGPGGNSLQLSPGSAQYHLEELGIYENDGVGDFDCVWFDSPVSSYLTYSCIYQYSEQEGHGSDTTTREIWGRPPSAWVFGDLQNLCQNALHGCGYAVDRDCDVHRVLGQEDRWAEPLRHQQPEHVWISLAQLGAARGTRNDKRAKRFECRIARAQLERHRCCVVEADEGSAAWGMPDILELIDYRRWCTGRVSFADDVDDTGCKVSALTASSPIDQRTRDKARKAADPERKAKKRPQTVEQVFDDCGSDFAQLHVANEYELDEVCYGVELREDQHVDEQPCVMMSEFFGMAGSEAHLSQGFSALNRVNNYSGWLRSRRTSAGLARIAAAAACTQMDAGRHSVSEQPLGSDFYKLDDWRYIANDYAVAWCQVDQCMAGKIGIRTGLPIKKSPEFWASDEHLIAGLRKFRCDGQHEHALLAHGGRGPHPEPDKWRLENPKDDAEWGIGICRELAMSISHAVERVRQNGDLEELEQMVRDLDRDWQQHWMEQSRPRHQAAPQDPRTPSVRHPARRNLRQLQPDELKVWMRGRRLEPVTSRAGPLSTLGMHCGCFTAHIRKSLGANFDDFMFASGTLQLRASESYWPKSMALSRLATGFTVMVQWGTLYIGEPMVAHMIEATRWTVLYILDRKTAIMIIAGITGGWIRPHGPMKLLISDIEGGLHGEEAPQWLDRWGIEMKAKDEGSHAQLVKRHHDLTRKFIHRARGQLAEEGIVMPLEIVIAECALIKNLLITVVVFSPYQAVHGRLPPLLAEFEPVSDCQIDDQSAGIPGRAFQVRPQDLRRSLVYFVMFTNNIFFEAGSRDPVSTITSYADQLDSKVVRVGWLFDAGWKRTADSGKLSELVLAVLHVAASGFYLVGCVRARVGNGVSVLEGMVGCDHSFLWWWRRGHPELSWYHEASRSARLKLVQIFGKDHWRDISFVQFIMTDDESVRELRRHEPEIPHLGDPWFGNLPHARRYEQPERPEPGPFQDPPGLQQEDFDVPWQDRPIPDTSISSVSRQTSASMPAPDTSIQADECNIEFYEESERPKATSTTSQAEELEKDRDRGMTQTATVELGAQVGQQRKLEYLIHCMSRCFLSKEYAFASWQCMKEQAALPAVDTECTQNDFFVAAPDADHVTEAAEDDSVNSRPDCVEIGMGAPLMYWVYLEAEHVRRPGSGEIYVLRIYNTGQREIVVEREMNVLTLGEARAHEVEVRQAMKDELQRWAGLKVFQRFPKDQADNVIDSRWVHKWKEIDGKKQVRARLTVRGFKDMQSPELSTFAGTTTRWGQRLVNQVTAQRKWRLFSADISQAFLRGLTFEQVAAMGGEVKRKAQFTMSPGSIPVLRQLEGHEDYNPVTEVLLLLRCGPGLADAPRMWQVMLKQVLEKTGGKALISDPQIYVCHDAKGELQTTCGKKVLSMIEGEFGKMKHQYDRFECIVTMHEQDPVTKAIWTHQQHYVQQLRPLQADQYAMENEDGQVSAESHAAYMSLLGGIAWMTQTMAPLAVYVSYLQRQAKKPTVGDLRKISRLLTWIMANVKQLGVRFVELEMTPFHAMEFEGLAIRGCVIMLLETSGEVPQTGSTYRIVIVGWYSRKRSNVVMSTCAAELMALFDALGTGTLMNVALTEVSEGVHTANQMRVRQEAGDLMLKTIAAIDAKAVFDAISTDTIKITTDKRMFVPTLAAREQIDRLQLAQLSWIDTMDMLADGLTKGEIDQTALARLGCNSEWRLSGLQPVAFSVRSVL